MVPWLQGGVGRVGVVTEWGGEGRGGTVVTGWGGEGRGGYRVGWGG